MISRNRLVAALMLCIALFGGLWTVTAHRYRAPGPATACVRGGSDAHGGAHAHGGSDTYRAAATHSRAPASYGSSGGAAERVIVS